MTPGGTPPGGRLITGGTKFVGGGATGTIGILPKAGGAPGAGGTAVINVMRALRDWSKVTYKYSTSPFSAATTTNALVTADVVTESALEMSEPNAAPS